jgi:large subunit ribosomal protein L4
MPNVIDATGKVVRELPAPAFLNAVSEKLDVIYRAVHREFANSRAGTASTKKRDEVAGGGRKPWRQKGTGRARQGSIRSPQWRHGGVVFGPQPRSYVEALNKKERRLAFAAALANRFQSDASIRTISRFRRPPVSRRCCSAAQKRRGAARLR